MALIVIVLLCLFSLRRRRLHLKEKPNNPVDLLQGDNEDGAPDRGDLPQFYQPEPFLVSDPTVASSDGRESYDRRQSTLTSTTTDLLRSGTPDPQGLAMGSAGGSTQTRKTPLGPSQLRPVNIIQHDDAGDGDEEDPAEETIELPPAYTNIRKPRGTTTTAATNDNTVSNEAAATSST